MNARHRSAKPSTRSSTKEDDPVSFAIAATPDRSLKNVGSHVRLKRNVGRPAKLAKGTMGVVVTDAFGACKPGFVAVLVPGHPKYVCLPEEALEMIKP